VLLRSGWRLMRWGFGRFVVSVGRNGYGGRWIYNPYGELYELIMQTPFQ